MQRIILNRDKQFRLYLAMSCKACNSFESLTCGKCNKTELDPLKQKLEELRVQIKLKQKTLNSILSSLPIEKQKVLQFRHIIQQKTQKVEESK